MSALGNRCCLGVQRLCSGTNYLARCPGTAVSGVVCARPPPSVPRNIAAARCVPFRIMRTSVHGLYDLPNPHESFSFAGDSSGWGRGCDGGGNSNNYGDNGGRFDGFGEGAPCIPELLGRALLGAVVIFMAVASFPAQSQATPGFGTGSLTGSFLGSPNKEATLSSSAPSHSGGFATSLDGVGMDPSRGSSASTSPLRPRSKVMHVACKGSTLVVPLPSGNAKDAGSALPHMSLWQRAKVVDAPIELSEREARLVRCRQNRVRDSLFVQ